MNKTARKYRPNLSTLMNLCEVNYMLMLKILADKEQVGEQRCFSISDFLSYTISVNEVTRYTSLVTISQDANFLIGLMSQYVDNGNPQTANTLEQILRPKMVIRLYHDARMAEVISNQDIQQVKPRYDYPNAVMHLPDEKQQINAFLKEWLQLCYQLGQVQISLSSSD